MSDSASETVEANRLPEPAPRPPQEGGEKFGEEGELTVGQRWHELTVEADYPDGGSRCFVADHGRLLKKVLLRMMPITDATEWRRGAWERLCSMPDLQIVRGISAEEEGGWRYEISDLPPLMTLHEWLACHRPGFSEIETLVTQLAATLGALHAQGVVHLNIRPTSIFIDESGPEPLFILGGLHEATLYTQPDVMPSDVDPRYAPPEAAGVVRHAAGTRLCAWDWWSTGRVVQEFLLGRHVLGVVWDRDVSRMTPELREKAEQLLLERAPAGVRAGALEYMSLEPALAPLLRGLLTGSWEARWGFDAVRRWLKHEPVQDYYDLPRHARFWSWRGRGFTVAEAAQHFCQAEHWEEGKDLLFQRERPDTLAAFLADSPAHKEDFDRLQHICDLSESVAWGDVPVVARRTVTAALAWLSLANGSGVRTALRICGEAVDVVGLAELLRKSGSETGVALFTALLSPVVINFVEPLDASAARTLKSLATKGGEAIQHGVQHGWLDPHDTDARARIFELALKAGALLREPIDLLRSLYATSSNAALGTLLGEKNPSPRDAVILAFTAETPERHGYITHEGWKQQRCGALQREADEIVSVLFWIQLRRILAWTVIWGAPTPVFAGMVLLVTGVVAWLSRSAGAASAIAALLLLSRVYCWWRLRVQVRKYDLTAMPWLWADGLRRGAKEAEQAVSRRSLQPSILETELRRIEEAMALLLNSRDLVRGIARPRWWDLWTVSGASVAVTILVLGGLIARWVPAPRPLALTTPASVASVISPAEPEEAPPATLWGVDPAVDIDALVATGRYEIIDDGFGRQLRGPLREWTFLATGEVYPLDIIATAPASAEQSAFALVSGTLVMDPYPRRGVSVLLAVSVPTTRGFGFLVFNTRDRKLLDHTVRLVREPLEPGTWYQLGSKRIGYLGRSAGLQAEISLAPP
jgi:hypothetical protein